MTITELEAKWERYAQIHREVGSDTKLFLVQTCAKMESEIAELKRELSTARRRLTLLKKSKP